MDNLLHWNATSLPMIHEIGFMSDSEGILMHPDRIMQDWNVLVFVTNGTLPIIEDGKQYVVKPGQFLFLKEGIHHWGNETYEKDSSWYFIHFSGHMPTTSLEEYSLFRQTSLLPRSAYQSQLTLPKYGDIQQINYFTIRLQEILETFQSANPLRPLLSGAKLYEVFIDLYAEKLQEQSNRTTHRTISKMLELFHQNNRKLSSQEISEALNMNYSYLSKQFKEHTGKSIIHYQNEILIEKAIQIFKKENDNISEVSERLGFSNPFYFSRVFKKVTGVSPSMYLKHIYKG